MEFDVRCFWTCIYGPCIPSRLTRVNLSHNLRRAVGFCLRIDFVLHVCTWSQILLISTHIFCSCSPLELLFCFCFSYCSFQIFQCICLITSSSSPTSLLKFHVLTVSSLVPFLNLLFFTFSAFRCLFSLHFSSETSLLSLPWPLFSITTLVSFSFSLFFPCMFCQLSLLCFLVTHSSSQPWFLHFLFSYFSSPFSLFYFFQHFHFFTFLRLTPFLSYCFFTFASLTSLLNLHFFTFSSLTHFFTFSGFPRVAQCRQRLWRHGHRRRRRPLRCLQRRQGCRSHRSFL